MIKLLILDKIKTPCSHYSLGHYNIRKKGFKIPVLWSQSWELRHCPPPPPWQGFFVSPQARKDSSAPYPSTLANDKGNAAVIFSQRAAPTVCRLEAQTHCSVVILDRSQHKSLSAHLFWWQTADRCWTVRVRCFSVNTRKTLIGKRGTL